MSAPVIKSREHYSDTTDVAFMSDDSELFMCRWPGCNFSSENAQSVPSHYRAHTGKAAQERRAKRRPRHGEIQNEVLEAALALLDRATDLIDKLDAFDAEFSKVRKDLADAQIKIEEYREREELRGDIDNGIAEKARRYDLLVQAFKEYDDGTP